MVGIQAILANMLVEITAPVFKCAEDERVFLTRLRELSGYQSVVGKDQRFHLTLAGVSEEQVLAQLGEVCAIWHTQFELVSP